MENNNPLLIALDPGHGGYDNGAMYNGRAEKDDNLRLGLAVRDALNRQGVGNFMTRDTDVFISLADRARMANERDADLFVAIHRNSYVEQTPTSNGLENYIYLTAPESTSGRAAKLVLDAVVSVAAQRDRGVSRGNYYVLRKTTMPSMLLEMGFIIDDEDNRQFDEYLYQYAEAIAKGIMEYFGLRYNPDATGVTPPVGTVPPTTPPVEEPVPPVGTLPPPSGNTRPDLVRDAQQALNTTFGSGITVDGIYGQATKRAAIRALQQSINDSKGTSLTVDGILGPKTRSQLPTLRQGDRGNTVTVLQILLKLSGYDIGGIDGVYGARTKTAVSLFQRDNFLVPDGVAGPRTFIYLLQ